MISVRAAGRTANVPPAPAGSNRLRESLVAYGWSRLLTLAVATMAGWSVGVGPLAILNRWDAGWFVAVARDGYPHHIPTAGGQVVESTLAFFPLFPLLLRIATSLTPLSVVMAGVAVSMAAGAVAVLAIHRIALRLTGDPGRALRAVTLFSFFPGSMVLSMPYSEGLMVALAAGCLLALLEERWWTAGLCAALATASRASALALLPACLWAAVAAVRRDRHSTPAAEGTVGHLRPAVQPFVAPLLAPLGAIGYFAFLWARTGDPLTYLHAEAAWKSGLGFGRPAVMLAGRFLRAPFTAPVPATATLSLILAVVAAVLLARRRWPAVLSIYAFSVLTISLLTRTDGLRPRDLLTAFPLFLAAADVIEERWMRWAIPCSATLLALSLALHNLGPWRQP